MDWLRISRGGLRETPGTRREDPEGDRVRVIVDGKFLKYQR